MNIWHDIDSSRITRKDFESLRFYDDLDGSGDVAVDLHVGGVLPCYLDITQLDLLFVDLDLLLCIQLFADVLGGDGAVKSAV